MNSSSDSNPDQFIGGLVEVHRDGRRAIFECNGTDFAITRLRILASTARLGDHYHATKNERFIVDFGGGMVFLQLLDTEGRPAGELVRHVLEAGSVVIVNAYVAHTFVLRQDTVLTCYATAPFDEKNKDINPYRLATPGFEN